MQNMRKAFDMHVLGVRRNKERPAEGVESMHGIDELPSVLAKSDYIVLAAPITKETRHLIGKPELAAVKSSAFLINVSRGNLIEERALHEALTSGRLRGYAADVWWSYESAPLKRAFPGGSTRLDVHKLPNVLCSFGEAHNADDVLERNLQYGIQSLVEFTSSKPITREIDLELGY